MGIMQHVMNDILLTCSLLLVLVLQSAEITWAFYTQSQSKLVGIGAVGNAYQGYSVAISGDGMTACVGGEADNSYFGAVWFYTRSSSISYNTWTQQGAKIVPNDNSGIAEFGLRCSMNFNGSISVIGGSNDNIGIGATWIITRNSGIWAQNGNKLVGSGFISTAPYYVGQGWFVSIASNAGNVLVTGGYQDNSGAGAAWVFSSNTGGPWTQVGNKLVGSGGSSNAQQGNGVAISADAATIAVTGSNDASAAGSVWIFTLNAGLYVQQGSKFTASPVSVHFGTSASLSADGSTLVVGAYGDNSNIGAMFAFTRNITSLFQQQGGKNVGSGYVCSTGCVRQGTSVSTSADGNIVAVGGYGDNNFIGATWIWTHDGNDIWAQYGNKLVGSNYVGSPFQGNSAALSSDGSVIILGGYNDSRSIGSAWIFNDTYFYFISLASRCQRPNDIVGTNYDSCSYYIPNGTTCTPTCNSGFEASNSLSVVCNNGTLSIPTGTCLPIPTLISVCPDKILANVTQSVIVHIFEFSYNASLTCVLSEDSIILSFDATILTPYTITCDSLLWTNTTPNQVVHLNIANEGIFGSQPSLFITILGACDASKPGSVTAYSSCVCPPGTRDDTVSCLPCENGLYQPNFGEAICVACESNEDTNFKIGSISSSACVCKAANFRDPKTKRCIPCTPGMYCTGNEAIELLPGYWRANNITSFVLSCPGKQASCSGTQILSSSLCNPGYKGPLCTVCEHGYAKLGETCVICPPTGTNTFALTILVLFAIALAVLLIHTSSAMSKEEFKSSEEKAQHERLPTLGVVVKVTLNYLQVLYYIGRLSANWSAGSIRFFTVIGQSTLTPNFPTIQCAATWTFYHRLILIYVSPLIVVAVLVIVYGIIHIVKQKNWKDTRNDCQYAIMLLLYQVHPTLMIEVISSLPCEKVPGSGTSYLKVDMSVDCSRNAYKTYAAISSIYLVVYIAGMIVLVSHRLHHNYISDKLFQTSSSAHYKYAFFFKGFRKHTYYWEAIVMMRKLIIVALSAFASPGLQLVWASVVIGISFTITSHRLPYSSQFINRLENLSLIALFIAVILGFHFLLTNGNHLWTTVLLILINGGVALFLLGCCLSRLQDKIRQLDRFLPQSWRGDGKDDVVMRTRGAKTVEIEMQ